MSRKLLSLLLVFLVFSTLAWTQGPSGNIAGMVTDTSGAVVPRAQVSVRNLDTSLVRSLTTSDDGRFNFVSLPVGTYEVSVNAGGFAKYVRGPIILLLNQTAVINPGLKPAAASETITVTEDAPLINTTNAEVGVRFDSTRLSEVGNVGANGSGLRDVYSFALSAPGVSQTNSGNSAFSTGANFSVNGMRLRSNNFMIDGQDTNEPGVTGRAQPINNPDVVQEFRLITNQPAAEYGHTAGAVVTVATKSGGNAFHGSAYEFYNGNVLNSRSNLDKQAGFVDAPWTVENQFGGTLGGPIRKDHTFFFGSLQRWTTRALGSGATISGVPTDAGRQLLQSTVGSRPQVQALLKYLPAAQAPLGKTASYCTAGILPNCTGGTRVNVPLGSLTGSTSQMENNWQSMGRIDHHWTHHAIGGRYLYTDDFTGGSGQATPSGLTTVNPNRQQSMGFWVTSNFTSQWLNDFRVGYQRYASVTNAADPSSQAIPSIEVNELGLTGFNAASDRTAIGLAVNLPQFRYNNLYQIQDTVSYNRGSHAFKFGFDSRRTDVKSFFVPTTRGRLQYNTLQDFVNDVAQVATINKPLPGGQTLFYYRWYDYFMFAQDSWRIWPTLTLNYGLRYELPGNTIQSLYPINDRIVSTNGGSPVFRLNNRPGRDTHDFQPRFGFSWNPHTSDSGIVGHLTGGEKLVVRGGYARTNDYAFLNIALNIASSFPFVAAPSKSNLANAFTALPNLSVDLSNPALVSTSFNRTIVAPDLHSPVADQYTLELQRELTSNTVVRLGWVATRGSQLFQTLDGNPRIQCSPVPVSKNATTGAITVLGCPRVDPSQAVVRLRANTAGSIYHSMQLGVEKRMGHGISAAAHYTWSSFIDDASEIFNASTRGDIAVSQNSFDRGADRGRSTYDRPHRFTANFIWELPFLRNQQGLKGHFLGGWHFGSITTFQSGSPWTPLNGSDPTLELGGIDSLVGSSIRPDYAASLNVSKLSPDQILAQGSTLFRTLPSCTAAANLVPNATSPIGCNPTERVGSVGRNVLRSDKLKRVDLTVMKAVKVTEGTQFQLRLDMFNATNTRNFGIPEARVNNAGFGDFHNTDGGKRTMYVSGRFTF